MILWSINVRPSEDRVHLYDEFWMRSVAPLCVPVRVAPHELAPTMPHSSLELTNPKLIEFASRAFEMTWPPTGRSLKI